MSNFPEEQRENPEIADELARRFPGYEELAKQLAGLSGEKRQEFLREHPMMMLAEQYRRVRQQSRNQGR